MSTTPVEDPAERPDRKHYLSVKQAAPLLGLRRSAVYRMVETGTLRAFRTGAAGKTIRLAPDDVEAAKVYNAPPPAAS